MKLNPECIRVILLDIESTTTFSDIYNYDEDEPSDLLKPFSSEEVLYHIRQAYASGLITKPEWYYDGACSVADLTPNGHEFLNNIRQDNNWNKTKEVAKSVGSTSIGVLVDISKNVISNLINQQFIN